jgi:hypothetical protein
MQAALLPRTQLLRQFMPAAAAQQLPLPFHGMQTRDFSQKKKATAKSRKKVGRKNRDDLPKIAAILKKLYMKVGSALVLVGGGGERKNAGRNSRTRGARRACAHLAGPPRLVGAAPANVRGQRCQLSEPARVPRGHQGVRGPVPAGGQAEATLLHAHGWRQRYVLRLVRRLAAADHTLRPTARC